MVPKYLKERKKENDKKIGKFPASLWEKINKIQQLGGSLGLSGKMQEIMNKSNFLINQCQHTLNSFKKEEADDNQQRQRYGNDCWIRKPSRDINFKYIGAIQNYIQNLQTILQVHMILHISDLILKCLEAFEEIPLSEKVFQVLKLFYYITNIMDLHLPF